MRRETELQRLQCGVPDEQPSLRAMQSSSMSILPVKSNDLRWMHARVLRWNTLPVNMPAMPTRMRELPIRFGQEMQRVSTRQVPCQWRMQRRSAVLLESQRARTLRHLLLRIIIEAGLVPPLLRLQRGSIYIDNYSKYVCGVNAAIT
jgi:hypothetical protein